MLGSSQTDSPGVLKGEPLSFSSLRYKGGFTYITCSIGYVEFRSIELVEKAIALSGTVVMGLPIMVQLTESERNRLHPGDG